MALGPVQILVVGFGPETEFRGDVLDELDRLSDRGLIRVLDLGFARRTEDGEIVILQASGMTAEQAARMGQSVKRLLGAAAREDMLTEAVQLSQPSLLAEVQGGIASADLEAMVDELNPGESVAILMFEHTWAVRFREILRLNGGVPIMQGFITPELTLAIGAELEAISEAAEAVEIAEAIKGAAFLDALTTVQAAEELKAVVAADVVRTLMVAGLIEDAAVTEAINALYAAELIEEVALADAEAYVAQVEAETAAAIAMLNAGSDE